MRIRNEDDLSTWQICIYAYLWTCIKGAGPEQTSNMHIIADWPSIMHMHQIWPHIASRRRWLKFPMRCSILVESATGENGSGDITTYFRRIPLWIQPAARNLTIAILNYSTTYLENLRLTSEADILVLLIIVDYCVSSFLSSCLIDIVNLCLCGAQRFCPLSFLTFLFPHVTAILRLCPLGKILTDDSRYYDLVQNTEFCL